MWTPQGLLDSRSSSMALVLVRILTSRKLFMVHNISLKKEIKISS